MSAIDLSFVEEARVLEVEAVEGGRPASEFTFAPAWSENDEELPVVGRAVDYALETEERLRLVREYVPYACRAYNQRGLTYPFKPTAAGDSLEVTPGGERLAKRVAELSGMIGKSAPVAKHFEEVGFRALQKLIGGWGACVGAPRRGRGLGAERAIRRFRGYLTECESGDQWPEDFAPNGDHGADGFLILGRGWGGPIVFYQAKNTNFRLDDHPEEFARIPAICLDWVGVRHTQQRSVIRVFASNTVLTLEKKHEIYTARGDSGAHMIDAVDIAMVEFTRANSRLRRQACQVF
jgi:hypothetical protein